MYVRKMYATGSAAANAVASLTIPSRSRLVGIWWSVQFDWAADNSRCVLELSRASATEVAVNGSQQCISEVCFFGSFTTSGEAASMVNQYHPCDVNLDQGQIVYLHCGSLATTTYTGGALLWLV